MTGYLGTEQHLGGARRTKTDPGVQLERVQIGGGDPKGSENNFRGVAIWLSIRRSAFRLQVLEHMGREA